MNAKNDDHTISLHLLPTTSLENVNHINFGVSQEANIDVSQYTNMGEGGGGMGEDPCGPNNPEAQELNQKYQL